MKKVAIVGSRDYNNRSELNAVIHSVLQQLNLTLQDIEIVSGLARGADTLGEEFAIENNLVFHPFPAEWNKYGRGAGHIRNREMAKISDIVVVFWNGTSTGSKGMIQDSHKLGCDVWVWNYAIGKLMRLKGEE